MTLCCIVGSILRELAEGDEDAELLDAPARGTRCGVAGGRPAVLNPNGVDARNV